MHIFRMINAFLCLNNHVIKMYKLHVISASKHPLKINDVEEKISYGH